MQHSDCVEREVIRVLQKRFSIKENIPDFDSDLSIATFDMDFSSLSSVDSAKKTYLLNSFLRKWKGLDTKIDLAKVTFDGWIAAEQLCEKTNTRLTHEASIGNFSIAPSIISDAQRKIAQVLGRFNFSRIAHLCRFGKGSTFDLRRGANISDKMKSELTVTSDCLPFAIEAISGDLEWQHSDFTFESFSIVRGNRMLTVPKSSKTHRMIAAEPTMNGFVQQSVGRFIRMRLKSFGVNLDDQTINQELAQAALIDDLSTIDLASASDTLSIALVKILLPGDWFDALNAMRSRVSTYQGKTYYLSKFSSMGNAFTFELESLIFWALSWASSKESSDIVSVYGDDIVVENSNFEQIKETLTWSGFKFNDTKSFTFPSRFYESCGKHYFDLEDISPAFQKDVCLRPIDYIRLHNRLVRCSIRLDLRNEFRDALTTVLRWYERSFPKLKPIFGPNVDGDFYFIDLAFDFRDFDYVKVSGLLEVSPLRALEGLHERMLYAYKLRHGSQFLNGSPKGYAVRPGNERFILKRMKIWRSSFVT